MAVRSVNPGAGPAVGAVPRPVAAASVPGPGAAAARPAAVSRRRRLSLAASGADGVDDGRRFTASAGSCVLLDHRVPGYARHGSAPSRRPTQPLLPPVPWEWLRSE